ncbi:MAG TPA: ribosome biogenesis GTP-binding protein YihA/YsxC [Alphaproteobacteria bacterium]|nr:ribosome biogenesis GTP-binding protein YihA/YsxC [Alphaproteobacteria bacterium]
MAESEDPELSENARRLFAGACDFVAGAQSVDRIPDPDLPEIGFCGRSNVGKSSLLNALTGRKALARVSHTPGRTQQINFFRLGEQAHLVDMPGYGYAKVSKGMRSQWDGLIRDYLRGRTTLRAVLVLVDSRHGLKSSDGDLLTLLDECAVSARIVLTKTDEAGGAAALTDMRAKVQEGLRRHPSAFPEVLETSARTGIGIDRLRAAIYTILKG